MPEKSKKDLAFDRERTKFRRKIRELECELKIKEDEIAKFTCEKAELECEIEKFKDWNARLLEFMDIPEEELKKLVEDRKEKEEIREKMVGCLQFSNLFKRGMM